jgi:phage terminase small subunit
MNRRPRLRKLDADGDLLRRRAAGEPLRQLAGDYDVAHTTLCRYFARPEVKEQLKKVVSQLRAEQRRLTARRAAERRLEREVRRRAEEQAAAEAEQARRYRAQFAAWSSGRRARGSGLASWLDERDAPWLPPTRADRHSTYDKEAEQVVAAGGGTEALLAATELPTLEAAADSIDADLLAQAFDNDALERAQPQPLALTGRPRLRRLVPDTQLLRRRAAGEPLRMLASEYDVAHTTLARFLARPEIKRQLRQTVQELRAERQARTIRRSPGGNPNRDGALTPAAEA